MVETPQQRPTPGRRPLTSKHEIVTTTLGLVDSEGLASVSMRRLAARLGVRASSVYNHVTTKTEILDAVADSIVAEVDVADFDTGWRSGIAGWARSYYTALAAHPNMVPWFAHGPQRGPASLGNAERIYRGLRDAGWPPLWATRVSAATRHIVFGAAMGSFAAGFPDDPALYATYYPRLELAHRLRESRDRVDHSSFELSLRCLLTGLDEIYIEVGGPAPASEE